MNIRDYEIMMTAPRAIGRTHSQTAFIEMMIRNGVDVVLVVVHHSHGEEIKQSLVSHWGLEGLQVEKHLSILTDAEVFNDKHKGHAGVYVIDHTANARLVGRLCGQNYEAGYNAAMEDVKKWVTEHRRGL